MAAILREGAQFIGRRSKDARERRFVAAIEREGAVKGDFEDFEQQMRALGCDEVVERAWEPLATVAEHAHPFDAIALVVAGELWLTVAGESRHLRAGDRFELAADTPHAERYGAQGATYWVGRRSRVRSANGG
jgi:uncharacterized cupin superfamily protein